MPTVFKSTLATATTSDTTLYTCPAATTAIVTFLQSCNKTATAADLTIKVSRSAVDYHILKDVQVDPAMPIKAIDGEKLVLQAGDLIKIQASANSTLDVILSITEIS